MGVRSVGLSSLIGSTRHPSTAGAPKARGPWLAPALLTAGLLLLIGCEPITSPVFRGPWLNDVTQDAITVVWETPAPSTATVRYGTKGALDEQVEVTTARTHHEVRLEGLDALAGPSGEVELELEVAGKRYPARFRTPPAERAPFSFLVYGDNRSSPDKHAEVVEGLMREVPEVSFAVNTGDLVNDGQSERDWDEFFPVAAPFLATTPLFVAIGNHEIKDGRWDVTRRLFAMPTTTPPASNDEGFYHVIYGNAQLIFLNVEVNTLHVSGPEAGAQEAWLHEVLAERPLGVDHRFVFIHQGPYSSKPGREGNVRLRQWLGEMKHAGVDVIFSGHDHYAERGFTTNGIHYVIHGGGGAPLYDTLGPRVTDDHTIMYGETRLGHVRVDVDGPKVAVTIKAIDGSLVDSFSYGDEPAPECRAAADCGAPPMYGCPEGSWSCERASCRFRCQSEAATCYPDR